MKVLSICPHRAHLIPGIGNQSTDGSHSPITCKPANPVTIPVNLHIISLTQSVQYVSGLWSSWLFSFGSHPFFVW